MEILAYRYKLKEVGYRVYNRIYIEVRTNYGIRKIYKNKKSNYIVIEGRRHYIPLSS